MTLLSDHFPVRRRPLVHDSHVCICATKRGLYSPFTVWSFVYWLGFGRPRRGINWCFILSFEWTMDRLARKRAGGEEEGWAFSWRLRCLSFRRSHSELVVHWVWVRDHPGVCATSSICANCNRKVHLSHKPLALLLAINRCPDVTHCTFQGLLNHLPYFSGDALCNKTHWNIFWFLLGTCKNNWYKLFDPIHIYINTVLPFKNISEQHVWLLEKWLFTLLLTLSLTSHSHTHTHTLLDHSWGPGESCN